MKTPCVYIVGTGPGDPSLISVRGQRIFKPPMWSSMTTRFQPRCCRPRHPRPSGSMSVPRRHGPSTRRQSASCWPRRSAEGKTVVRLKWGDPFVFDSGGKEALLLREQGVPFEIVPGIPAAIGGAAYAGIPLTYPGADDVVIFVRGHEGESEAGAGCELERAGERRRHDRLLRRCAPDRRHQQGARFARSRRR